MIPAEGHAPFIVPREEIRLRVASFQQTLCTAGVGMAWIDHLTDRCYLSGSVQDGVLLVPAEGDPAFYVRKSVGRAEAEASIDVEPYPGRKGLLRRARDLLGEGGTTIGLAMDVTPAGTYRWLQERLSGATFTDLSGALRTQRATKSPWEVEQIRQASRQVTTLFHEVEEHLRPGMTELELTGAIEGRLRALGHGGTIRARRPGADVSMATVVCGDSALYPTNFVGCVGGEGPTPASSSGAGRGSIRSGQTVMLDIVTSHNGYHADTTRVFVAAGELPKRAWQAHDFCRHILVRIEERLRPGAVCAEIYREMRELAVQEGEVEGFMGFGENRVRFFGHGVGLELDELPVLAEKFDTELRAGMVLAVEPKAFLRGIGPVGVENTYVITEDGCENLCLVDDGIQRIG